MNRQHRYRWLVSLALVFGLLFVPAVASANMANPHQPGDPLGEPTGGLESVAIEHESLVMDLRPLADDHPAVVDATYNVRNDGTARTLHLEFIATGLAGSGNGVWLDGASVPVVPSTAGDLPASWQPPKTTPGIGGDALDYGVRKNGTLTFDVNLAPGRHQIHVHYLAKASAYSGDSPARYWQLGYVLAPARSWASFGGLDVRVRLPPGWRAASNPALTRAGDDLRGSFSGVPADALGLTVQAPVSAIPFVDAIVPASWLVGLIAAILVGVAAGRWLGRRRRTVLWAIPLAVVVGCVWTIVVIVVTVWDPSMAVVPDSQAAWTYQYGRGILAVVTAPLAFLIGLVVTFVAEFVGSRRLARSTDVVSKAAKSGS